MIENSLDLVKVARELGILVIHVTKGYTNDYREVDMGNGGESQSQRSTLAGF